jgi:hypothetical protein
MALRPELHFRLPNSPGALASVLRDLDAERVRVYAMSIERSGDARLVVDNPERARTTLAARHIKVEMRDAIVTKASRQSVGALLASVAASGVNVEYAYMSSFEPDGMAAVILGVDDAMSAAAKAGL